MGYIYLISGVYCCMLSVDMFAMMRGDGFVVEKVGAAREGGRLFSKLRERD